MFVSSKTRMVGVMVRIPPKTRDKVKQLALKLSSDGNRITESDIYRSAIEFFLKTEPTNCREDQEK